MSAINPKPNSALHRTPLRSAGELYRAFARKTPSLLRLLRLRSARVRSVLVRAGRMSNDAEPFRDIMASRLEASCLRLARWPGPRYAPCREQYRTGPECGMPGAETGKSGACFDSPRLRSGQAAQHKIDVGDGDSTEG